MSDPIEERRFLLYRLERRSIIDVLSGWTAITEPKLPQDARVANVGYDQMADGLIVVIASMEFGKVPNGATIPSGGPMRLESVPRSPESPSIRRRYPILEAIS